ncbi:MAG: N-acetylmuramoyl-L-alanine amidase [Candidatus Zixiibacteriota bacterium]
MKPAYRSIAVWTLFALAVTARADKVKIAIAGGFEEIRSFSEHDIEYVSLSELADALGGSMAWEITGHTVSYSDAGFRFEFLIGSPWLSLNDTTYNMTYDAAYRDGQLFVPAETFLPLLDRVTPQKITWEGGQETVRVDSDHFNVIDMSVQAKANGLLIDIYLSSPLAYEILISEGNWINISMRNASINRYRVLSRRDSRYMYDLKVHQVENNTGQISLRLRRKISDWSHKIEHNPTRIQIIIKDPDFQMDTSPAPAVLGPDDKIDVIVIDAGHGGDDYGAIGQSGTREKDVTLSTAKRLAGLIRKEKQFKVVMTRDRDKTVSLEERARIANDAGADLFISIHANASPRKQVRGWNVFFLAPALNDSARAVAQLENSYFMRESYNAAEDRQDSNSRDPLASILSEMLMTEFQAESHELAQMVDREFRRRLDTPARGIDQAGFFVLNKVFTPSVLIESAFISNPQEEKLLKDKAYQEKVAAGLYEAIKRFKAKYESD